MTPNSRIYQAWQNSGLTQPEYAKRLGVPIATLRNWFRPEDNQAYRNAPESVARLAEILGEE